MGWMLLIAFERHKLQKESGQFAGGVSSPEVAGLENQTLPHQWKVWPLQRSLGEKTKFKASHLRFCGLLPPSNS